MVNKFGKHLEAALQGKTIVVTGAAGFIGSHLCDELLSLGAKVIGIDNFSTGKKQNLEKALKHKEFQFIKGDVAQLPDHPNWVAGSDAICHQAALGSVPRSIELPLLTHEANSTGFLSILETARKLKIKRVVYASSSSVYGDTQALPKIEEDLGAPLSPYAITKLTNELYAKIYFDLHELETIGLRYFNVFGSRQDPQGPYAAVIPRFFKDLYSLVRPTIFGSGDQCRDFTHVSNVVAANLLALTTQSPVAFGKALNVGCGDTTSVNTLFLTVKNTILNLHPELKNMIYGIDPVYRPSRPGDVLNSLSSVKKSQEILGYSPFTSLENGLIETDSDYFHSAVRGNLSQVSTSNSA